MLKAVHKKSHFAALQLKKSSGKVMKVIFIFMIQLKMSLFSSNVEDLKMVTLFYILLPSFDLGKWKNDKRVNTLTKFS